MDRHLAGLIHDLREEMRGSFVASLGCSAQAADARLGRCPRWALWLVNVYIINVDRIGGGVLVASLGIVRTAMFALRLAIERQQSSLRAISSSQKLSNSINGRTQALGRLGGDPLRHGRVAIDVPHGGLKRFPGFQLDRVQQSVRETVHTMPATAKGF